MAKVFLSPSNQYDNRYAYGNTTEGVQCGKIAEACKAALERSGVTVKLMHDESMQEKCQASNAFGADLHVPIHTNAGGGHGPLVLVYSRTIARMTLAQPVYDAINAVVPTASKYGVQAKPGLYEVANSTGKCVRYV